MTTPHPFAHDDAAYVLGALSPDERTAFAIHLASCTQCQARVAEISAVPGLLAGITEDDFAAAAPGSTPPDTLLPSLLRAARRGHRRRIWVTTVAAGLAAAAIAALSIALASPGGHESHSPTPRALAALVSSPVHATAVLTDLDWGTRITLACRYEQSYAPGTSYRLVVRDRQGRTEFAGSWQLEPGKPTTFTSGTWLHRDQIKAIEIDAGRTPILQLTL
ncbi:MAG: hypothetical protein QOG80_2091 [Pseudonocardiales bacterium]|jgi:hypothetical protein|nr:hypothetical protein [Pseudonocardiales bacterium]